MRGAAADSLCVVAAMWWAALHSRGLAAGGCSMPPAVSPLARFACPSGHAGGVVAELALKQGTQPELGPDVQASWLPAALQAAHARSCVPFGLPMRCRLSQPLTTALNIHQLRPRTCCLMHSPRLAASGAPQALRLDLTAPGPGILRARLTDPRSPRWEVPPWLFKSPLLNGRGGGGACLAPVHAHGDGGGGNMRRIWQAGDIRVELKEEPFGLEVSRAAPGQPDWAAGSGGTLFNTTGTRLAYKASLAGRHLAPLQGTPALPGSGGPAACLLCPSSCLPPTWSRSRPSVPAGSVPGAVHVAECLCCALRGGRARLQDPAPCVSAARQGSRHLCPPHCRGPARGVPAPLLVSSRQCGLLGISSKLGASSTRRVQTPRPFLATRRAGATACRARSGHTTWGPRLSSRTCTAATPQCWRWRAVRPG